jgi:hypothetical protein
VFGYFAQALAAHVPAPAGSTLRLQIYSSNCADIVHACCLQLDLLTLQLQVLAFALDPGATRTALSVVPQSTARSSSSGGAMQAPFASYSGEARSSSVVVVAPQGDSSSSADVCWLAQQLLARRSSSAVSAAQQQQRGQQPMQAALREAQRCVRAVCRALASRGAAQKQQPPLSSAHVRDAMWAAEVCDCSFIFTCIYALCVRASVCISRCAVVSK